MLLLDKIIEDFESDNFDNKAVIINENTVIKEFASLKPLMEETIKNVFAEIIRLRKNGAKTILLLIPYDTFCSPFVEPIDNEEQIKKVYDKYKRS